MSQRNGSSTSIIETVAGLTAGVVSTLTLHPLDLIKTRLQIDRISRTRVGSSLRIFNEIYKREGGLRALYRGLTPNIIGNSASWSLYFLFYGNIKDVLAQARVKRVDDSDGKGQKLSASEYFLASGAAGLLTSILTNPIWVIKTRMLSTGSKAPGAYPSFIAGATQILRTEGIRGFYRGLVPALFGVSHGAFQFMAYEKLKSYRLRSTTAGENQKGEFSNIELLLISGLSKTFAGCITYPYQVLRTRLQLQAYNADAADAAARSTMTSSTYYRGVWDATKQIWAQEGLSGFYKGLGPSLVRVLPSTWVVFLVYENTKAAMYKY
ncbi:mitochondrial folate carrier protein Flx1, putative [Talaromyces stipitatus ATCC 10500]|uniref:Mitochondrial folate carrier protein Flx1, putative n=1 Tax=Talaromyces stipitatus (strain ATCC 10500 / CBS 375.48 / QM 6759 / NRRL 1006) TaxID=441959 RepID=B8MTQ1_TALSN|nr:mitochondrial folate carrier protein Flx1, putative [Talaromyces stipitatus ATCC 10500]EED12536.1 mitochondrial folate carrier protein Flx1, putative [Talaromyces stipitatus ATCC 10500]